MSLGEGDLNYLATRKISPYEVTMFFPQKAGNVAFWTLAHYYHGNLARTLKKINEKYTNASLLLL